jgi:hypothetical protein
MGRLAVQPSSTNKRHTFPAAVLGLLCIGVSCLNLCGCANFWDDVQSRDFSVRQLFKKPDYTASLRDPNPDNNQRYKALAGLHEPLVNGGTQQEQDETFKLLETAATKDQAPLCRLAALSALGRFKDARAATVIDGVFDQQLPFTKDMNTLVREQCLMSLIETGGPVALQRLVLVAKEPPSNGPAQEYQETLDRQLIAVRGLAKFKQPEATAALAYVLCAKKNDVALRDRAHESLVSCTGKDLPPDSAVWQSYLAPGQPVQQASGTAAQTNTPVNQASGTTSPAPQPDPIPQRTPNQPVPPSGVALPPAEPMPAAPAR